MAIQIHNFDFQILNIQTDSFENMTELGLAYTCWYLQILLKQLLLYTKIVKLPVNFAIRVWISIMKFVMFAAFEFGWSSDSEFDLVAICVLDTQILSGLVKTFYKTSKNTLKKIN